MGLLKATESPQKIIYDYKKFFLSDRIQLFLWVLAQIPIQQWKAQLAGTRFYEEAFYLNQIYHYFNQNRTLSSKFKLLTKYLQEHQTEPLLPYIERIKSGIDFKNVVASEQSE